MKVYIIRITPKKASDVLTVVVKKLCILFENDL